MSLNKTEWDKTIIILHFPERAPFTVSEVSSDKISCRNQRKQTLKKSKDKPWSFYKFNDSLIKNHFSGVRITLKWHLPSSQI